MSVPGDHRENRPDKGHEGGDGEARGTFCRVFSETSGSLMMTFDTESVLYIHGASLYQFVLKKRHGTCKYCEV